MFWGDYWDMVVKANDGGGIGHAGRISNWIGYDPIKDKVHAIVNGKFHDVLPEDTAVITTVMDRGFRVNLDTGTIDKKFDYAGNIKSQLDCVRDYYLPIMMALDKNIKLFYLDDQNSPETIFPEELGTHLQMQLPRLRDLAPNAKIVVEMETQEIYSRTMGRALEEADIIHLSSSKEFVDIATDGAFNYITSTGIDLEDKVKAMGFPLGDQRRESLWLPEREKQEQRQKLFEKYSPDSKYFVNCIFGGARGANDVFRVLKDVAERNKDILFGLSVSKEKIKQAGLNVEGDKIEGLDNLRFTKVDGGHLRSIGIANVNLQGCGSGGTYEGIWAENPILCIPLKRPGEEQVIKALGVERCGGGKALFLEGLLTDPIETSFFSRIGYTSPQKFSTPNVENVLKDMIDNPEPYKNALIDMKNRFFPTGQEIAQQIFSFR